MAKTTQRADKGNLPVLQLDDDQLYVRSEDGRFCYQVVLTDTPTCTCPDYARHAATDPLHKCKHLLSALNEDNRRLVLGPVGNMKPKLHQEYILDIDGKNFVTFQGLLDLAHQIGLRRLSASIVQLPTAENGNTAVVQATAESQSGAIFEDVGDANPSNCNSKVSKHLIRMASTRSLARALRSFTNVGMAALEELDLEEAMPGNNGGRPAAANRANTTRTRDAGATPQTPSTRKPPTRSSSPPAQPPSDQNAPTSGSPAPPRAPAPAQQQGQARMSEAQRRAVSNLGRRRGLNDSDLDRMSEEAFGVTLENLNSGDAAALIRKLQVSA